MKISLEKANKKCEQIQKILNEQIPQHNWLVNISGLEIIICDLNKKTDFKYTKKNKWGINQAKIEEIISSIFKTDLTLQYYNNGLWSKYKAIVSGIEII